MAQLLLRGQLLGCVEAVLFDKDGTLSLSEPNLTTLAQARVFHCLNLVDERCRSMLKDLLERAYGLQHGRLDPAGTVAVASRNQNLISTATALCQIGMGWPQALAHSETVFEVTDIQVGLRTKQSVAKPTDGLPNLLSALDRAGIILGVISNDETEGIRRFLSVHGLSRHIRGIWSAEDHPAKPNPAAVERFCALLGVEASASALIGDADSDLQMAQAAGMPLALGYLAGWRTPPTLKPGHPLIHHWSELKVLPELESNNP